MKKGFTLLELVIVILILGVLAAIGLAQYLSAIQQTYKAEAAGALGEMRRMELIYRSVYDAFDTDISDGIRVDVDADGTADITMSAPASPHFAYSYNATEPSIDAAAGTGPANNYRINLTTGAITTF